MTTNLSCLRRSLPALGLLFSAITLGASPLGAAPAPKVPCPLQAQDRVTVETGADYLARDSRIKFDKRSANFARLDLDDLRQGDFGRSTAIVALGASRSMRARSYLLEETALGRLPRERAAATYGLGELGERGLDAPAMARLVELLDDPDPTVQQAALVGLVRTGSNSARREVAQIAGGTSELSAEARQVLAHHIDPRGTEPPPSYTKLYQLRWGAGRTYGLIDGQVWGATLMTELASNKIFLEAFTLFLARDLDFSGAKDHMLEILIEGEGAPRIFEAAQLMPAELEMLVDSGVWQPQDLKEWRWLVLTILNEELYASFPQTLLRSMSLENSPTRWIAAGLLYREDRQFKEILDEGLNSEDPTTRAYAAYSAAAVELEDYLGKLKEMCDDPHPWVQANAIAGLIRMGSQTGAERANDLLALAPEDRPKQLSTLLFEVLEREAPDPEVMQFVETVARSLEGADRAAADALLLIHGGLIDSTVLRRELPLINPIMPEARRGVRGLARNSNSEDIKLLARMFPREAAPGINVELAVALAKATHRGPEPLLAAAVWKLPFHQSVLAAGCVRATYGEATLLDWVVKPPAGVETEDIRRLGWAIGEWGGVPAVQALQRRLGTTSGAEIPALQGAILGAYSARTR